MSKICEKEDIECQYTVGVTVTSIQGSICEISGAGVGFWGRRLRRRMTTPAALSERICSHGLLSILRSLFDRFDIIEHVCRPTLGAQNSVVLYSASWVFHVA